MSGFDLDYSQATDFSTVSDGTYEVAINKMVEDATKSGAQFINIDTVIRNDIKGQQFQNKHVFRRIFAKKETGKYPKGMLMSLAKAAGLPNKTHFESFPEDYFSKLYRKPLLITVKNQTSEYNGKTYENTNITRWEVSKFPKVAHKFRADEVDAASQRAQAGMPNTQVAGNSIDISDDSLPF